jgi:hypothetical protein
MYGAAPVFFIARRFGASEPGPINFCDPAVLHFAPLNGSVDRMFLTVVEKEAKAWVGINAEQLEVVKRSVRYQSDPSVSVGIVKIDEHHRKCLHILAIDSSLKSISKIHRQFLSLGLQYLYVMFLGLDGWLGLRSD